MTSHAANPHLFFSAGEASGDHYGAELLLALQAALPEASVEGLGGPEMEQAGMTRIVRAEDVTHMGITEVVRHAPSIFAAYRRLVRALKHRRPDAAVLIDFPDVNFRLAKHLKRLGVPVIWFVSPQLWAWKRRRLRWVQQRVTRMLTIFPFEEPFYRARGVDAEFVGHPLADLPLPSVPREVYAAHHNLDPDKPWVALLPGSRWREVEQNLPTMVEMACRYPLNAEYLLPIASTLSGEETRARLASFVAGWIAHYPGTDPTLPLPYIHLVSDAREALFHARASVVASGTATVQAALIGNPFVVVYRVSSATFKLAKSLVWYPPEIPAEVDRFGNLPVAMPNLVAGQRIVPELLQEQFNPKALAQELTPLLREGPERQWQRASLAGLRDSLRAAVAGGAILRVRDVILEVLSNEPDTCSHPKARTAASNQQRT